MAIASMAASDAIDYQGFIKLGPDRIKLKQDNGPGYKYGSQESRQYDQSVMKANEYQRR